MRTRISVRRLCLVPMLLLLGSPLLGSQKLEVQTSKELVAAARLLYEGVNGDPTPMERFRGERQRDAMLREFDHQSRQDWSYWPRPRAGLALEAMGKTQRQATHTLLRSLLSAKGYLKVVHIMQLEDVLRSLDTFGLERGLGAYYLTLFGEPTESSPWGFRFEGHHVSLNVTVGPGAVRVTPSFMGASPNEIPSGMLAGFKPLGSEEDLARDLLASLSGEQRKLAIGAAEAPADIVSTNLGRDMALWDAWRDTMKAEGLATSDLDPKQLSILEDLLAEIFGDYQGPIAGRARSEVNARELVFLWLGSTEPGQPHYYRIINDRFVFEYDNVQGNATHVHTVWREHDSDFGADLLGEHYSSGHQP